MNDGVDQNLGTVVSDAVQMAGAGDALQDGEPDGWKIHDSQNRDAGIGAVVAQATYQAAESVH